MQVENEKEALKEFMKKIDTLKELRQKGAESIFEATKELSEPTLEKLATEELKRKAYNVYVRTPMPICSAETNLA